MDIVLNEAKKRDMKLWILDDKYFPTGYANGLIEKKYPERKKLYLACTTADIFGGAYERSLNVNRMRKPSIGGQILYGAPVEQRNAMTDCVVILEQKNIVCNAKNKSIREQIDGLKIRDISADWTVSLVK